MKKTRRKFTSEFKVKVAIEALKERYSLSELGYFGVTVPLISVKQCHFERSYNYIKN